MYVFDGIPFFAGLDPARSESFARQCVRKRYAEEELVLDFDDQSTDVYFIVTGEVRVLIRTAAGKEMIFGEFGAGKFFGEMAAVDGAKRSANVTALTNAELLIVPPAAFREIVLHTPEICDRLLRLLTARVRELNIQLFERSVLDLRHRTLFRAVAHGGAAQGSRGAIDHFTAALPARSRVPHRLPARAGQP